MRKEIKAQKIVDNDQLFKRSETDRYEYWIVKGSNGVHEIIYDGLRNYYTCDCKNVKLVDCYHILAIKLSKRK